MPNRSDKQHKQRQKDTEKNSAPKIVGMSGKVPAGPSAKQRRHERRMEAARAARVKGKRGGEQRQIMINQKAETRRRMSSYTPAVRAERSAAGREHRNPRK